MFHAVTFGHTGAAGFVGRQDELTRMDELAAKVRASDPVVVWIRGDAGIGKTTLVRRFLGTVTDFTVLEVTSDETETVLEYGLVEQIARRAAPAALRAAPLLDGGVPPGTSPLVVGTELLALLGAMQAEGPVALVVDDLQWADPASRQALAFVLRRIWADQVLVVLLSRSDAETGGNQTLEQLRRSCPDAVVIDLPGLRSSDIAAMSVSALGEHLGGPACERLHAHTGGNPLHVRTLLYELPAAILRDIRYALPAPQSIVAAVRSTLEQLPERTRLLLEALAVLNERGPLSRAAYVGTVDNALEALDPGLRAGLVRWWPQEPSSPLCIAYGLQRDAIYGAIAPVRRGELHRRAAEVVDHTSSWAHRVAATTSSDPELADQLEAAANSASADEQYDLASRYLQWAADLSDGRPDYERRLLNSCVQTLFGPNRSQVLHRLADVTHCAASPLRSLTLGLIMLFAKGDRTAATHWLTCALELIGDDPAQRRMRALSAAGLAGAEIWRGSGDRAIDPARLALRLGELPNRLADFVHVFLAVARARQDGMVSGLAELNHLATDPVDVPPEQLDSLACRGAIRTMLGRLTEAGPDLRTAIRHHRAGISSMSGTTPQSYLASVYYVEGRWEDAAILVEQTLSLADPEEQPHHRAMRHMVATFVPAGRGDWTEAREHVAATWSSARQLDSPQDLRYAAIAEATLHQARDDPRAMLAALRSIDEDRPKGAHVWWQLWWRPLLVEALAKTGQRTEAAEQFGVFHRAAAEVDYLRSTTLRLELLVGTGCGRKHTAARERVERLALEPGCSPVFQAMAEAELGGRLLEAGNRSDALELLRTAHRRFRALSARPFLNRVQRAMARCGAIDRPLAPTALAALSPREVQVAHLVQRNLTNREIAGQLYVTTKTVEFHLGNIYLKLGITGRSQLRQLVTTSR